jgi:molybdenum cofactor biosynthesis enzyme MoaA
MLLQLKNTNKKDINKLLNFAKQNHLELSLIDDNDNNYFLPGRPLSEFELNRLIESSRKSEKILLKDAHSIIRESFNAD